jgi:hypothetical protein
LGFWSTWRWFLEASRPGLFDDCRIEQESGGEPQLFLKAVEPGMEVFAASEDGDGRFLRGTGLVGFEHVHPFGNWV